VVAIQLKPRELRLGVGGTAERGHRRAMIGT
jgi:hypothetical protein